MNLSHLPNDVIAMILCDFVHIPSLLFQDNWTDAKPKTQKAYTIYSVCRYIRNDVLHARPKYDYEYECVKKIGQLISNYTVYSINLIFIIPYYIVTMYIAEIKYLHIKHVFDNYMKFHKYNDDRDDNPYEILAHIELLLKTYNRDRILVNTIIYKLWDHRRNSNVEDFRYYLIKRYSRIIVKYLHKMIEKKNDLKIWRFYYRDSEYSFYTPTHYNGICYFINDKTGYHRRVVTYNKINIHKLMCEHTVDTRYDDFYEFMQYYEKYIHKRLPTYRCMDVEISNTRFLVQSDLIIRYCNNWYLYSAFLHNLARNHYKKCYMMFSKESATYSYKDLYEALTAHPDELKIFNKYYNLMYDKVHKTLLYNDFFC